jgi:hypothetical protein
MTDLIFDFTWYKDRKGYRLVPATLPARKPGQSVLDVAVPRPARIVRKGGALEAYQPLKIDKMFEQFIKLGTEDAVFKFVKAYGPLTHDGLRGRGERVPFVLDQVNEMHKPTGVLPLNKLNASIVAKNGETRLRVSPTCLLDAIWLQLAQANTRSSRCPQCREWFLSGIGSGLRAKARFCSAGCRKRYHSLKRSWG